MPNKAAMRGTLVTLQDAQTALGAGLVIAIPDSFKNHTIYIIGNGAVGAGAVQIETTDDGTFSGTWAPIGGGPVTVVANAEVIITFIGVYKFLRVRISTVVTVGTVTVKYVGS
jgi:hypothetical protein